MISFQMHISMKNDEGKQNCYPIKFIDFHLISFKRLLWTLSNLRQMVPIAQEKVLNNRGGADSLLAAAEG